MSLSARQACIFPLPLGLPAAVERLACLRDCESVPLSSLLFSFFLLSVFLYVFFFWGIGNIWQVNEIQTSFGRRPPGVSSNWTGPQLVDGGIWKGALQGPVGSRYGHMCMRSIMKGPPAPVGPRGAATADSATSAWTLLL